MKKMLKKDECAGIWMCWQDRGWAVRSSFAAGEKSEVKINFQCERNKNWTVSIS